MGGQTGAERLAAIDLQHYLARVTGRVPRLLTASQWQRRPAPAVLLGTLRTNPLLSAFSASLAPVGEQGFWLANRTVRGAPVVVAAGRTPEGAVNAVYGLLRELGFGFYLGSEAVPDRLPARLSGGPIRRSPAFRVRGVLPWYNFFDSPTAWDPVDHRAFVDSLVRMGANFVGFHSYDAEPFAAWPDGPVLRDGARLASTAVATWGTSPMRTRDFAAGTDRLFDQEYFGAATTRLPDDRTAVLREQEVLRDALDYARKRGLKTCLGFEMSGDPTQPADRNRFVRRLEHLLDRYPALDYVWIWQSETVGALGFRLAQAPDAPGSPLALYGAARRETFRRVVERRTGERPFFQETEAGKAARALEGARLEQFSMLAWRVLRHRVRAPRLVVSGWGGDERLLSAEYYAGLDRLLPKDVAFASLDHITPRERVDGVYSALSPGRERWPVPWLENDGDQWQAQPFVHTYEKLARDAQKAGCQGLLGIHWRTRDVEENFAFLVQYAWQPGLTAEAFFRDYARRCYGARLAGEMARIHTDLDRLGYRWIGGWGQAECAPFAWGTTGPENIRALERLRDRVRLLLPRAGRAAERLEWLLARMEWALEYAKAQEVVGQADALLAQARAGTPGMAQAARDALALLNGGALDRALRTYTRRVSTRGEYGVLATVNAKAVISWRALRREAARMAGQPEAPSSADAWNPAPQILLPRQITSLTAGQDAELRPVALGGGDVWMHLRSLGQRRWTTRRLQAARGWVRRGVVPGALAVPPGLEIGFSFYASPLAPMAWGPTTLAVFPRLPVETTPPARMRPAPARLTATARPGRSAPVELSWPLIPPADGFVVYRDGRRVAETAVSYFPDAPDRPAGSYVLEALRDGRTLARSAPVAYRVTAGPTPERPRVIASVNRAAVLLRWQSSPSLHVTGYVVRRVPASGGSAAVEVTRMPAAPGQEMACRDTPPPGRWSYAVAAVAAGPVEGPESRATVDFPAAPRPPVTELPLTTCPAEAQQAGAVSFGPDGAAFAGGWLVLPHREGYDMANGLTVRFAFRADDVSGMPVLLSHGAWQVDGWFVQILGGRLTIRTPSGDAVGPTVEPGRWYRVEWRFDGVRQRLEVDGRDIPQAQAELRASPAARALVIGQYEQKDPQFSFRGVIRNLTILEDVEALP